MTSSRSRPPRDGASLLAAAQRFTDEALRELGERPGLTLTPGAGSGGANGVAPAEDVLPHAVCLLDAPDPAPIAWLIPDLWTDGDIGLLVGPDGSMKSTIALHLAAAVAGGYPAFTRYPAARRPVLVVSGEDPQSVIRNRLEAMIRGHGWSRTRVLEHLHLFALAGADLTSRRWQLHLAAEVERTGAGFLVLDPLADLASGDENDNSERRAIVQALRRIAAPTGAAICLVHHAGKPGAERSKRDRIRGASALAAASRCTYFIESSDSGIAVECLKLSRGERVAPFVVRPTIHAHAENRAVWELARLEHTSRVEAALDAAETFVLAQLGDDVRMTTTDLKGAAKGTGVSGADIARALRHLETRRLIDFEPGEKNAKRWGRTAAVCLPGKLGNQKSEVAGQPACLPGNHPDDACCLPGPFRGPARQAAPSSAGQAEPGAAADPDAAYLADERAALEAGL